MIDTSAIPIQSIPAKQLQLANEAATIAFGTALAHAIIELYALETGIHGPKTSICVHLNGDLGAGKSTLARALLRSLGVTGKIKSPTYALLEPYDSAHGLLLHVDLYRLTEPAELEYLGLDSLFADAKLMLIEWPEKAGALLPAADLNISLAHNDWIGEGAHADSEPGRTLQIAAFSKAGNQLLLKLVSFF